MWKSRHGAGELPATAVFTRPFAANRIAASGPRFRPVANCETGALDGVDPAFVSTWVVRHSPAVCGARPVCLYRMRELSRRACARLDDGAVRAGTQIFGGTQHRLLLVSSASRDMTRNRPCNGRGLRPTTAHDRCALHQPADRCRRGQARSLARTRSDVGQRLEARAARRHCQYPFPSRVADWDACSMIFSSAA